MMKRSFYAIITVVMIIGLVLLCGCTSTPSGEKKNVSSVSTEKTNVSTNSGEKTALNIGYQPSTHQMSFMTAYSKGWYNESLGPLGIKDVNAYNFPTGAPEMQAMIAKNIDFAYVGSAPVVTAVANGLDAKIIGAVQIQGSDLVLRTGLNYTAPGDLKGLKIATFPAGTIQDTILRTWLKQNGIDSDKDLQILPMGPGDASTAIIAGKVDAVFLPHPSPTSIEEAGAGKIIVHSGEMDPGHACCVLVASGDMIRNHPDIVEQILKVNVKASEYNKQNIPEAAGYMAKLTGMNASTVEKSLKEWDGQWVSDPSSITKSVDEYTEEQIKLGYIKTNLTEKDLFDTSFYKKLTP